MLREGQAKPKTQRRLDEETKIKTRQKQKDDESLGDGWTAKRNGRRTRKWKAPPSNGSTDTCLFEEKEQISQASVRAGFIAHQLAVPDTVISGPCAWMHVLGGAPACLLISFLGQWANWRTGGGHQQSEPDIGRHIDRQTMDSLIGREFCAKARIKGCSSEIITE